MSLNRMSPAPWLQDAAKVTALIAACRVFTAASLAVSAAEPPSNTLDIDLDGRSQTGIGDVPARRI